MKHRGDIGFEKSATENKLSSNVFLGNTDLQRKKKKQRVHDADAQDGAEQLALRRVEPGAQHKACCSDLSWTGTGCAVAVRGVYAGIYPPTCA